MNKNKFLVEVAFLLGFVTTGFADVTIDPVFSPNDIRITNQLEFADSNYYDHIALNGCDLTTIEIGKPLLPIRLISVVIPADEDIDRKSVV